MLGSISSWVQHHLLSLHGVEAYLLVGVLLFLELGIVIGFFIPGEIATIIGGVLVGQHRANLIVMLVVVWAAGSLGNWSGYEVGKYVGPWLLSRKFLKDHREVHRAQRLIARWGGPAVLLARWIALVRALMPALAGMTKMSRRVFLLFTVIGAVAWGTMWVLIGDAAGANYTKIVSAAGKWSLVAVGVVAAALVIRFAFRLRRWRRERHERRLGEA